MGAPSAMSAMSEPVGAEAVFQADFIPKQRLAPQTVPNEMVAFIATYPPLGQISQVQNHDVDFTAVLEVPVGLREEPWQLSLWHSNVDDGTDEWSESELVPSEQAVFSEALQDDNGSPARLYFRCTVSSIKSSLNFTVKFRQRSDHAWRWIRDEQGLKDGTVIINRPPIHEGDAEDLPDIISDLNPNLSWKSHMSQCPNTRLWSVQASVDGARSGSDKATSAFSDVSLGVPWGGFLRWFALARLWYPWLAPRHGRSEFNLDKDAIFCSFLSPNGKHLALLGVSIGNVVTLLRSSDSGKVNLHLRNDSMQHGKGTVLVAIGDTFEGASAAVMYHARGLVASTSPAESNSDAPTVPSDGTARIEWYENWYDGLGYCTWNALGQKLSHETVLSALDILADNGINVASLIIDDNWQDIDYRGDGQWQYGWNGFEAEPKAFPKGLKGLVSDIRGKHRSIQHIAVWHTILGYWAGLAPAGELAKKYSTVNVVREDVDPRNLPIDSTMTVVAQDDVKRFYHDFYQFLSDSGIDGVKTDGQYLLDTLVSSKERRDLIHTYIQEWGLASLRFFGNRVISCMSQAPQMLFSSQLPNNKPAMVVRNSDDYFPNVPSSHPWHIWANAYNSLLTMHLNVVADWDMFQTAHPFSEFHAAARCVSGGPVYITDVPGHHNIDLIREITGVTTRGKTVVFRPSVVGRAIDPYTSYEDLSLLKVGAYHGRAATGTPILGIFNVSSQPLTELIHLSRFSGVLSELEYVVRSHRTGQVSAPLAPGSAGSLVTVSVGVQGYDILCAFPLTSFEAPSGDKLSVTNLGLVGKMTGCAAILSTKCTVLENGRLFVDTTLKALGVLGIYISTLPGLSIEQDFMATIQGQPLPPHTVSVDDIDRHVLRIDVEAAWKEMGLHSGWANEVEVKVYFPLVK
ncbi:raffinose synthase Sip1 [Echria macrotheca]|uniref:Raffinose synthase Sip1 n=1 Tax=Echria macrotheca TaxID=438768 RepID=A0AAJ0BHN5_9PEZI|nr:raffinose synthase Sip1 [Echria macrotheca]